MVRHLAGFAAKPRITLAGIRMSAEGDKLLAVAQKFQLLSAVAIRRDEVDVDLLERLENLKKDRTLRCSTDTD